LRPYESIETSDSYYNHDDLIQPKTKLKGSMSKNHLIITYSMTRINLITQQNPKKGCPSVKAHYFEGRKVV